MSAVLLTAWQRLLQLPLLVGDGTSGGDESDFRDDEGDEGDAGNRTRYSGINFMNEGLGGRGGAEV